MKKVLIITLLMLGLGGVSLPSNVNAEESGGNQTIQPRAAIKEWRYKYENGHYYKRLFNYSTGKWEGNWILVA